MNQRTYIYGMRLRGFSPGTFPKKGIIGVLTEDEERETPRNRNYHDLLKYNRKLTDEELKEYELDFIGELD